jgi:putative hemolysin
MTIHEIEQAITELSPKELARFREWFEEFDAKVWDEQFERDAKSGKLDALANKALADFRAGKSKEL